MESLSALTDGELRERLKAFMPAEKIGPVSGIEHASISFVYLSVIST